MNNKLIDYIKDGYIQKTRNTMQYPDYYDSEVANYVDKKSMLACLNRYTFKERLPYLQKVAEAYERGDTPMTVDPSDLLNVFMNTIKDDEEFIDELIAIYSNEIYYHVSNQEDVYDGCDIEDKEELARVTQFIADFTD